MRAGGVQHAAMIGSIAELFWKGGAYCFVDTGDTRIPEEVKERVAELKGKIKAAGDDEKVLNPEERRFMLDAMRNEKPDVLVYPLEKLSGTNTYDPTHWNVPHRFAIECETDPTAHPDQVIWNFKKNLDAGLPVMFVVDTQDKQKKVAEILSKVKGAKVVRDLLANYDIGHVSIHVAAQPEMVQAPQPQELATPQSGTKETPFQMNKKKIKEHSGEKFYVEEKNDSKMLWAWNQKTKNKTFICILGDDERRVLKKLNIVLMAHPPEAPVMVAPPAKPSLVVERSLEQKEQIEHKEQTAPIERIEPSQPKEVPQPTQPTATEPKSPELQKGSETKKEKPSVKARPPADTVKGAREIGQTIEEYQKQGLEFVVRADNRVYASAWDKVNKKTIRKYVATWTPTVEGIFKKRGIKPRMASSEKSGK